MSSTSTSWSVQGNSKAGGTVTTTDAFTTGTLTADTLTLNSNKITFGNSEIIDNLTDEVIAFRASGTDDKMILGVVSGGPGEDCGLLLYEGTSLRWSMQHDASDNTDYALVWDYNNTTAGGATKMKLASDGDLTLTGDLTVTGADIIIGADADGTDRTITFGHSTLKTIAGIDDSEDKFIINCAATFESTLTDNDFYMNASAARFGQSLFVGDDLTVNGGDITITAGQDTNSTLTLKADAGDDAGDEWKVRVTHSNQKFSIANDIASAGSFVDLLEITPHATATSSTVTIVGNAGFGGGGLIAGVNSAIRGNLTLYDGGGTNTPGYIAFYQPDGDVSYVWVDNDGKLRIDGSVPSDSGGTVVGSQS